MSRLDISMSTRYDTMDTVSLSDSSKKVGRIPWDDGTIIQTPTRSRMQRSNSMQLPSPPSLDSLSKTGSSRNLNMMSPISSPSSKRINGITDSRRSTSPSNSTVTSLSTYDSRRDDNGPSKELTSPTASSSLKAKITDTMRASFKTPLYAHKYGTAAEAVKAFQDGIRSSNFGLPNTKSPASLTRSPSFQSKSIRLSGASNEEKLSDKINKKNIANNDDAESFLKTIRSQRGDGESNSTVEEQWLFLKSHFKMSDDDLEWLMVAKHKGAYKYAKDKHDAAEDKYFKGLFDQDMLEKQKKELTNSTSGIGEIPTIITRLSELRISNLIKEAKCIDALEGYKTKLKSALDQLEANHGPDFLKIVFSQKTLDTFKIILGESKVPSITVKKAQELHAELSAEMGKFNRMIHEAKRSCDEALDEMEKWSRRIKEADEYSTAIREEEEQWLEREYKENQAALETMRSYIPLNIADLTVNDLINNSRDRGGWFTLDLAIELKNNRLLHWVVTHKEDIAMANFLAGEKKAFFENIEALDLIEIRAIVVCLPEKFELDGDGRKNEWRSRIMARAKQMVAQAKGETVKGGWDGEKQGRLDVVLAPLKPEQERRPIYFYRSKELCLQKVKQYDDKEKSLKKKSDWLAKAKIEAEEAKKEYDIILNEMRDSDLKAQYGADKVAQAKKMAKEQWTDAETKRRGLEKEVAQLKATIASNPITKEDFVKSMNETEEYLLQQGIVWDAVDQPMIMVKGVFDKNPEVTKTQRKATKFVSAEEEAAIRKKEIAALKAQKDPQSVAEVTPAEAATITQPEKNLVNEHNSPQTTDQESTPKATSKRRKSVLDSNPQLVRDLTKAMSKSTKATKSVLATPVKARVVPSLPSVKGQKISKSLRHESLLNFSSKEKKAIVRYLKSATKEKSNETSDSASTSIESPNKDVETKSAEIEPIEPPKVEEPPKPIVPPKPVITKLTKSKLLQKLVGGAEVEESAPVGRPPMPSFLDQLKAKGKNPFASADGDGAGKSSFLDQIKLKAKSSA